MNINLDIIDDALVALAKRINKKEVKYWGKISFKKEIWHCLICDQTIPITFDYAKSISFSKFLDEHAISHIKEYKLAAFL